MMELNLRGKCGLAGIGGVLRNGKGSILIMFSKHIGICDCNEMDVLVILEESDSSNAKGSLLETSIPFFN